MSKKEPGVTVTKTGQTLPAEPPDESLLAAFEQMGAAGTEGMRSEDKAIPFIGLVQSLSPQRDKANAKYIPGAEEGDLFNTVTGRLYKADSGIVLVAVHFQKVYNAWIPRDAGGGFLGSYEDPELERAVNAAFRQSDYDGPKQVVATANHFVLVVEEDGSYEPALLSMTSTKLRVSRRWCSQMAMVRVALADGRRVPAPTFAKLWRLTSVREENDKGVFYNYAVTDIGWVQPDTFAAAVQFRESLLAGQVKVDYTKVDPEAEGADKKGSDDLPF